MGLKDKLMGMAKKAGKNKNSNTKNEDTNPTAANKTDIKSKKNPKNNH